MRPRVRLFAGAGGRRSRCSSRRTRPYAACASRRLPKAVNAGYVRVALAGPRELKGTVRASQPRRPLRLELALELDQDRERDIVLAVDECLACADDSREQAHDCHPPAGTTRR